MKNEDTTDAETDAETGAEEAWCPPMPDAPDDPTESEIAGATDKLETMMRGSLFFPSLADIALWLGPYMSINCQKQHLYKDTKGPNAGKSTLKNKTHDTQPRRPANLPARFAFRQEKQQTRQTKGQEPKNKNHNKDLPRDTADFTTVSTSKHAQINYPPRHSVSHRKRSTACSFVTINENCTLPNQIASLSVLSDVLVQEATTDTDMGRPSSVV